MSEPEKISQKVAAAIDALLTKKQNGQLSSGKRGSMASELRQRITDLRDLNEDLSAAAIATALTSAGCPVSPSTVQRVLREERTTKRKKAAAPPATTDAGKPVPGAPAIPPRPAPAATPKPTATVTDAALLLKRMHEENGGTNQETQTKRVAALKN